MIAKMQRRSGLAVALAGLVLVGFPAAAAPATPAATAPAATPAAPPTGAGTTVDELTVSARKLAQEKQARAFIDDYTTQSPSDQITRWTHPICPRTVGLPDAANALVTRRVREIAAMAGARLAAAGKSCSVNLLIVFTLDAQGFLDQVRSKDPEALGFHFFHDRKKVSRVLYPVQAWYQTETEDMNGYTEPDTDEDTGMTAFNGMTGLSPGQRSAESWRFNKGWSSNLISALVVVDTTAVNGLGGVADGIPLEPLADYVAMMGLSQTKSPDRCKALPTIANLVARDCPQDRKPAAITDTDIAYLKALYATDSTQFADSQRAGIAFRMNKILSGGR